MGQPAQPPIQPGAGRAQGPVQPPNVPSMFMDPVAQAAILSQIQRSGWSAAQPVADIQIITDPNTGVPTPAIKGYKMVITDPNTKTNETVDLTYAPGGKMPWGISNAPKSLPTDPNVQGRTTVKTTSGVYSYDPKTQTTTYLMPSDIPNVDEETSKAVERQDRESLRNEKEANQRAGRGYQTDAEYQKMARDAAAQGLSADTLKENIRQFDVTKGETVRQFDIGQAAKDKVDAQNILKSQAEVTNLGANTANIGATTDKTRQDIEQSKELFPLTLDQQKATTEGLTARTASEKQAMQVAAQSTLQGGLTNPYLTTVNPLTGQIDQSQMNQAYQAKTPAEISARVGQIQSLAQAKNAEVMQKVSAGTLTHEQALAEFNGWWDKNVEPQTAALRAAQEDAQFQRAKDQADSQRQSYQTALGAGTQSINAFNAEAANRVGPNYESVLNQIKSGAPLKNIDLSGAFTYKGPPVAQAAEQATQAAMQGMGGQLPAYNPVDITGQLNRTNYLPGGMAPTPPQGMQAAPAMAAAPAPAAPTPMAAPGMTTDWYAEWQKRQAADAAAQQMQAGIQINPLDYTNYVPAA